MWASARNIHHAARSPMCAFQWSSAASVQPTSSVIQAVASLRDLLFGEPAYRWSWHLFDSSCCRSSFRGSCLSASSFYISCWLPYPGVSWKQGQLQTYVLIAVLQFRSLDSVLAALGNRHDEYSAFRHRCPELYLRRRYRLGAHYGRPHTAPEGMTDLGRGTSGPCCNNPSLTARKDGLGIDYHPAKTKSGCSRLSAEERIGEWYVTVLRVRCIACLTGIIVAGPLLNRAFVRRRLAVVRALTIGRLVPCSGGNGVSRDGSRRAEWISACYGIIYPDTAWDSSNTHGRYWQIHSVQFSFRHAVVMINLQMSIPTPNIDLVVSSTLPPP